MIVVDVGVGIENDIVGGIDGKDIDNGTCSGVVVVVVVGCCGIGVVVCISEVGVWVKVRSNRMENTG
jgi:hypothetical protein